MSDTYSLSTRCAACKCLRRKCPPDCILAPHFPSSNPQRFASVHKVFGAANVTKMLEHVPVHLRGQAAECIIFEATTRVRDPVYGSVGVITQLQQQIMQIQKEILKIHAKIALQNVKKQQMQSMQKMEQVGEDKKSCYNGPGVGSELELELGMEAVNGRLGGEEVGSSDGQRYEIDLDEMYANFNC